MKKTKKKHAPVENKKEMRELTDLLDTGNQQDTLETPAWIKIFQERSEKLNLTQKKNDIHNKEVKSLNPSNINVEEEKEIEESIKKMPKISLNFDYETAIAQNEAIVQKSVKDLKSKLENSKHLNQEDEKTVTKRTTKVVDRVRKVKSLLLESTQKEMKLEKEKEIQVIKGKAKKN